MKRIGIAIAAAGALLATLAFAAFVCCERRLPPRPASSVAGEDQAARIANRDNFHLYPLDFVM